MASIPGGKKIREVRSLCERVSARRKSGLFVAEGERIFEEIPPDDITAVYMSESFERSHPDLRCDYVIPDTEFNKLADTKHPQGILAVVRQKEYRIDDISDGELFIILDAIQDPGNLGTIVRTAEAAGAAAVIMNKGCADIYSPKVVRSTMGSIFRVPFIYTEDLICAVDKIKSYGAYVYAATLSGRSISEAKIKEKRAFIIGNEGNGISADILSLADMEISIPMSGKVESLNAAVSAAILMYL